MKVLEDMEQTQAFAREIEALVNKYSWDNKCNMPDFILADYVIFCISALCNAQNRTREWGRIPDISPCIQSQKKVS